MDYGKALGIEWRATKEITHQGKPAHSVSGTRHYATDADDLWDALTNPERIPRWFLPISGDLRVGGRYQLEGHAGGETTRCDPPKALDTTWEFGGNTSWNIVRLEADNQGTLLSLEHIMPRDETSEKHWKQYGPGATGVGWELSFLALGYHIANGGIQINPDEHAKWMSSEAGKNFIRKSAVEWGEAHIKSGEDDKIARSMAELTARFYTGE
ncbi:MAG: SRPBCC family protein [Hyphomicrobiales bacterium]